MDAERIEAPKKTNSPIDLIEKWFVEKFHREPISTNTEHFNYIRRAVDDLKTRMTKEG